MHMDNMDIMPNLKRKKEWEFNGTPTHLFDGYISANQIFFSTFLSKITKYNRVPLGGALAVVWLLDHDLTPRPTCPELI